MTSTKVIGVVAVVALVVSVWGFSRSLAVPVLDVSLLGTAGGLLVENYDPYNRYNDGYKSENEIVLSGADGDITTGDDLTVTDDATVSGGTFTVTTTNTATSTVSVGCVQTTATSTATPIRLLYTASTTATAISGTQAGFVLWGYGSCPI